MNRLLLIIFVLLLIAAALLELTGAVPGAGRIAIPLLVLMAASLLMFRAFRPGREAIQEGEVLLPLEGIAQASFDVKVGAGDLIMRGDAPVGALLAGHFVGAVQATREGDAAAPLIRLRQPFSLLPRRRVHWEAGLSSAVRWDHLRLTLGTATATLDFSALAVDSLLLEAVRTTLDVTLPRAGEVRLNAAGGQATLRVPQGTAVEIISEVHLGEVHVDATRFSPTEPPGSRDETWRTSDAVDSPEVLRVVLQGGLGSIVVC